jgi:hypothetical protein
MFFHGKLLFLIEPWLDWVAVSFRNLKVVLFIRIPLADCEVIHGISDSFKGFRDISVINSLLSVTKVKIDPLEYLKFAETLWRIRASKSDTNTKRHSVTKKVDVQMKSLPKLEKEVMSSPEQMKEG